MKHPLVLHYQNGGVHSIYQPIVRVETVAEAPDGQQYKVFMLDADDSFDLVVEYPDGEREIVWCLVKEPQ